MLIFVLLVLVSAVRLFLLLIIRHKSVKFHVDRTQTGDKSKYKY